MDATAHSVSSLIARFQLRRRAMTDVFAAGTRLARLGAVTLDSVTPDELWATVHDPDPVVVRIVVEGDVLVGRCGCADDRPVCRHQVAAAHALWVRDRRAGLRP
jgi:uncharacterized Zn finger protein